MVEEQTYYYHCDRCGNLFKSKRRAKGDLRCDNCGENPLLRKFNTFSDIEEKEKKKKKKKKKKDISGKEINESFDKQKKLQRVQYLVIGVMMTAIIGTVSIMAIRMNEKSKRAATTNVILDEEDKAYLAIKNDALEKCRARFKIFAAENIVHAKSSHIFNGSDLILDINRYFTINLTQNTLTNAKILEFEVIENEKETKALALYQFQPNKDQNSSPYYFEVLFRKKGDAWLVDWSYLVRMGEMNWFKFNEDKTLNSPKKFSLYIRQPNTRSIVMYGYEEYKVSEPINNSITPSQLPISAYIKNKTSLEFKLTKKFNEQKELSRDNNRNKIIENFDPQGALRVVATVDFEEIDGEVLMVIKEIHETNWETQIK